MKKEDFEIISNTLTDRINACKKHLTIFETKTDLEDLSIKQLKELIAFSKEEYAHQSHILTIDLYHLLGMANLTVCQTSKIVKLVKDYTYYRPLLNRLGKTAVDLNQLPDITDWKSDCYIATHFNHLTFQGTEGALHESNISVNNLPYTYFNKTTGELKYNPSRATQLAEFLIKNTKLFSTFKTTVLAAKLTRTGSYGYYNFLVNDSEGVGYLTPGDTPQITQTLLSQMTIPQIL